MGPSEPAQEPHWLRLCLRPLDRHRQRQGVDRREAHRTFTWRKRQRGGTSLLLLAFGPVLLLLARVGVVFPLIEANNTTFFLPRNTINPLPCRGGLKFRFGYLCCFVLLAHIARVMGADFLRPPNHLWTRRSEDSAHGARMPARTAVRSLDAALVQFVRDLGHWSGSKVTRRTGPSAAPRQSGSPQANADRRAVVDA
jgi:hypothetical protein